jgi:hypothetical protein
MGEPLVDLDHAGQLLGELDAESFQGRRRAEQRALLAEATRRAVADDLYSDRAEDYARPLKAARHSPS